MKTTEGTEGSLCGDGAARVLLTLSSSARLLFMMRRTLWMIFKELATTFTCYSYNVGASVTYMTSTHFKYGKMQIFWVLAPEAELRFPPRGGSWRRLLLLLLRQRGVTAPRPTEV